MTERGLPTEGAPACPFVAFEDDRDGRSTAPDHRHRCFAEPRPAPRALAHQEAYCLSSAFPVCPTFQDWARREAAAARPSAPVDAAARDEPPESRPMPPLEREPRHATETAPVPPRRSGQRDWAAPPPWSADGPGAGGRPVEDLGPAAVVGAAGLAAASSGAGRAAEPDPDVPVVGERTPDPWGAEARGLAGSAADRLAGPDPGEPAPAAPRPSYARPVDRHGDDDSLDAWAAGTGAGAYVAGAATARDQSSYAPPSRRQPAPARGGRRRDEPRPPSHDHVRREPGQDAQELFGPAWEPSRRYEAYPTLRTRMGIPSLRGLPRIAVWALVLVGAAGFLFLFGPRLLGLVGEDPFGAAATPTPTAITEPTDSPEPTQPPAPTPQVYVVARGDTMSKIAKKFGVTVEEIMAANPKIKNPNRIVIGDEITIPVPESETGFEDDGSVEGESTEP